MGEPKKIGYFGGTFHLCSSRLDLGRSRSLNQGPTTLKTIEIESNFMTIVAANLLSIVWPYMTIYGSYIAIYGHAWWKRTYVGHVWPYMAYVWPYTVHMWAWPYMAIYVPHLVIHVARGIYGRTKEIGYFDGTFDLSRSRRDSGRSREVNQGLTTLKTIEIW